MKDKKEIENKIKELEEEKAKFSGAGRSLQEERVLRAAMISALEWVLNQKEL